MVTSTFQSLLLWLLMWATVDLSAQTTPTQQVLASEQSRFEAMMHQDTVTLQRLLSSDLVYIHSNALKENKLEHIRTIVSGKIVYQSMSREAVDVRLYGKTAVTCGTIHVKGIITGNPFDVRMLYTAIYHKQKHVWQLVNWQSTRLP